MAKRTIGLNEFNRPVGQYHPNARLSDADIDLLQELREQGLSLNAIAAKFDITKGAVWKVVHGYRRCQIPTKWVVVEETEQGCASKPRDPAKRIRAAKTASCLPASQARRELDYALRTWFT